MQKTACQINSPLHPDKEIRADFQGGRITSDAGWLLFYALDRQHRFTAGMAACIREWRDQRYLRHSLAELICQRVHQIVAGYEDYNDAQTLTPGSDCSRPGAIVYRSRERIWPLNPVCRDWRMPSLGDTTSVKAADW